MPPDKDGDWSKFYRLKWDAWNRLVEVRDVAQAVVAIYAYDGTTRRTIKTVSGETTHFYYNEEWRPVEERANSGTSAERQYLWGRRYRDDLALRERDTNSSGSLNERLYVTHDYFNPTSILDTSGNVQERYAYSAFGVRRIMVPDFSVSAESNFAWHVGFQGQFLDTETGYCNYGHRNYSSQIGRWMSKDSVGEESFRQSVALLWQGQLHSAWNSILKSGDNLYTFVGNCPVNHYDINGQGWEFVEGPTARLVNQWFKVQIVGGVFVFAVEVALDIAICCLLKRGEKAIVRTPATTLATVSGWWLLVPVFPDGAFFAKKYDQFSEGVISCDIEWVVVPVGGSASPRVA